MPPWAISLRMCSCVVRNTQRLFKPLILWRIHSIAKSFQKGSLKKFGLDKIFDELEPILLKKASRSDPLGIVRK